MSSQLAAQIAPPVETDEELQKLYNWVDEIPLSRPKRNISRDFADGVLFAEIVNHFFPRIIEMHNYSAANSNAQKLYNWNTLNSKVLKKLGYQIHQQDLDDVIKASPGAVERVLLVFQDKIAQYQDGSLKVGRPSVQSVPRSADSGRGPGGLSAVEGLVESRHPSSPGSADGRIGQQGRVSGGGRVQRYQQEVDAELLLEKEGQIAELREVVTIMSEKIKKLEQLVRIKDSKIEALNQKLQKHGLM